MMDYVLLLRHIRNQLLGDYGVKSDYAVVVVGSSYSGLLAAWLRITFPSTFQGALASSAPLRMTDVHSLEPTAFHAHITQVFARADPRCPEVIRHGFRTMIAWSREPSKFNSLSEIWKTCRGVTSENDIQNIITTATLSLTKMAVTNYPFPTDFMAPLPAWPVHEACQSALALI